MSSTLPGVGPTMTARVPETARQAIVVMGGGPTSDTNIVTMWTRASADSAWEREGEPIPGRNGMSGWTASHREGDRATPIGVFTLTAAGGRQPDPGTLLPYEYRPSYYQAGNGDVTFAEAFDFVVAVDYNRQPGYPPSDPVRPHGDAAGGDIWIHVDHASPTRGCITVPRDVLVSILGWLSPASRPVIIMGDAASLAA